MCNSSQSPCTYNGSAIDESLPKATERKRRIVKEVKFNNFLLDISQHSLINYLNSIFSMELKKEIKANKITTAEEKNNYKSGAVAATVGKGEKRMAHVPKVCYLILHYQNYCNISVVDQSPTEQ